MSEKAIEALRLGRPVVLPFDTVYGLAAEPYAAESTRRLYALKGRPETQPTALVAADLELVLELVPELRGRAAALAGARLPGPLTLVVPNPARRFPWVTGGNPETIGIRVPELEGPGRDVLDQVGVVVATSANRPGEPDPRRLDEVPEEIRAAAGALVDAGALPGTPSTVVDLSGVEPRILREGAVPAADVMRRLDAAVRST